MKSRHYFLFGLALAAVVILAAVVFKLALPYTYQGTSYDPPMPAADLSLTDQRGERFQLSSFRQDGQEPKVAIIFFGYSHCPDVCPITLAEFIQVKKKLGGRADQVNFIFITVDPERDTSENLQAYMKNFDPDFIGLTGSEAELQPVWDHFGVYREKANTNSAGGYLMDHSARTYVLDADGQLVLTYAYGFGVDKIADDLAHLVEEQ